MSREDVDFINTVHNFAYTILNLGFDKVSSDQLPIEDLMKQEKIAGNMAFWGNFFNRVVAECVAHRITIGDRGEKVFDREREYTVDKIEQLTIFQDFLNRHQINVTGVLNGYPNVVLAALNAPRKAVTIPTDTLPTDPASKSDSKIELKEAEQYQKNISELISQIIYSIQEGTKEQVNELWRKLNKLHDDTAKAYLSSKVFFDYKIERENTLRAILDGLIPQVDGMDRPKIAELDFLLNTAASPMLSWKLHLPSILKPYLETMVDSVKPEDIEVAALLLRHAIDTGKINSDQNWKLVGEIVLNAKPETVITTLYTLRMKGSNIKSQWSRWYGNVPDEIGPIKDLMEAVVTYCLGCLEPTQMANIPILLDFLIDCHISVKGILNSSLRESILEGNRDLAYLLLARGAVPKDAISLVDNETYKNFIQEALSKGMISDENLHKYLPKTSTDDVSALVSSMTQIGTGSGVFKNPTTPSLAVEDAKVSSESELAPLSVTKL